MLYAVSLILCIRGYKKSRNCSVGTGLPIECIAIWFDSFIKSVRAVDHFKANKVVVRMALHIGDAY